jgi:predicted Zn-dependent protease
MNAVRSRLTSARSGFAGDLSWQIPRWTYLPEVEVTRHRLQRYLHEMAWFLAQQSLEVSDMASAERALLQLLAVDPHDLSAREELVEIYRKQGKEGLAQELEGIGVE